MNLSERCKKILLDWGSVDHHGIWSTRRDFKSQIEDLESLTREIRNEALEEAAEAIGISMTTERAQYDEIIKYRIRALKDKI